MSKRDERLINYLISEETKYIQEREDMLDVFNLEADDTGFLNEMYAQEEYTE